MGEIHRIEGIKYNFDRLRDDELVGIRSHLLETHQRVTDEIGLLDRTLFERAHDQLPLDTGEINYERLLGRACLDGELSASEVMEAMDRYDRDE